MDSRLEYFIKTTVSLGGFSILAERQLSPVLVMDAVKKEPLLGLLGLVQANGSPHRFKRLNELPDSMWEGVRASANETDPDFAEHNVVLRVVRSWGSTFLYDVATIANFNALSISILSHVQSVAYRLAGTALYGDEILDRTAAGAAETTNDTSRMFDGLLNDPDMKLGLNLIEGAAARNTQAAKEDFDNLINVADIGGTSRDLKVLIMSTQMATRLANVHGDSNNTGVRLVVNANSLVPPDVNSVRYVHDNYFPGGLDLSAYRGRVIYASDFTRPIAQMPSITATASSGGQFAAGTYHFALAPVTWRGEQVAAKVTNVAVTANQKVTFTGQDFKFPGSKAKYTDALYYRLYRTPAGASDSPANYKLVGTYPSLTFDANGTPTGGVMTTGIVDTGAVADADLIAQGPLTNAGSMAAQSVINSPDEVVFLINVNGTNGVQLVGASDDQAQSAPDAGLDIIRYLVLGRTKDAHSFLIRAFAGLAVRRGRSCAILRGVMA